MTPKQLTATTFMILGSLIINTHAFAQEVLDKAQYRFHYEYAWEFDTISLNNTREDLVILQIGQNISKSYSYPSFYYDSLRSSPDGERAMRQIRQELAISMVETGKPPKGFVSGGIANRVYKNYPEGQMTITDRISANQYMYNDELHAQSWHITDSTKTILDYTCQMAVSDFRGRRWIAWFAPDIPISDGPWKFSGLPGLIMEVYDSEYHHRFEMVGIENVENDPINFSPVILGYQLFGKYEETTRIAFLRAKFRHIRNMPDIMNAQLGVDTFDASSPSSHPHDFLERDYW
jgi:GLPGLI family protein